MARKDLDTIGSEFDDTSEMSVAERYTMTSKSDRKAALARRKKSKNKRRLNISRVKGTLKDYPYLLAIKPKECYIFHSDYFKVDDKFACILGLFHNDEAMDNYPAFWGVGRITRNLSSDVSVMLIEQVSRRSEKWVQDQTKNTEKISKAEASDDAVSGSASSRRTNAKKRYDLEKVVSEIQNGASYLQVHDRLLLKAPSLEELDEALEQIKQSYSDMFATLKLAPYHGEQRTELTNLLAPNNYKLGKGFHFTSAEFAGSYSLVTNGINDADGEYVGIMTGDMNESGVSFNVNGYNHHVVVADGNRAARRDLHGTYVSDMWGSKIAQSALLNGHKVIYIVLNSADLDLINPDLSQITVKMQVGQGNINMFELFGSKEDELALMGIQMDKLALMTKFFRAGKDLTDINDVLTDSNLKTILQQFYQDEGMLVPNAKNRRDRLRLVGIPHEQVPLLSKFNTYLEMTYQKAQSSQGDQDTTRSLNILRSVYSNILMNYSHIFETTTSSEIDNVWNAKRVIYDFASMLQQNYMIAMAQLVNILAFAFNTMGNGDLVIIHGANKVHKDVRDYINSRLEALYQRGGRAAFIYNSVIEAIDDREFNNFDKADYTVFGNMSNNEMMKYQEVLGQAVPVDLQGLVTSRGTTLTYLRRGITNVVFEPDLALGINPRRKDRRRQLAMAYAQGR